MKKIALLLAVVLAVISCGKMKEKVKSSINKSGETVGQSATEFFEGVSEGIDKSLQCELFLSHELINKGIKTGKFSINSLPERENNNLLTLYLIFNQDFKDQITVKAFNKSGLEIGRTKLEIESKSGDAGYYDFIFDKRTHIEVKSKFQVE